MPVDTVIMAIGQTLDVTIDGVERTRRSWVEADPVTLQTNLPDVFAGGDAVSGPASVVEAVGQAHRAAESIRRYLMGEDAAIIRTAKDALMSAVQAIAAKAYEKASQAEAGGKPGLEFRSGAFRHCNHVDLHDAHWALLAVSFIGK